jgi:pimeloyl-ACP methyl ester carboxylesterase
MLNAVQYVTANGLRFAYLAEGAGPLVLLLHGFPDTAQTWDRALGELARAGFRAVAPFMRGYHPTALDGPYDPDTLGRDVLALIEALGESQAIVVGHDWGASAAYSAAALGPARVRLLVTLAIPHPRSLAPSPRLAWSLRHFVTLRRASAAKKIRDDGYAYIDELWRRWSPAWREIPPSETSAVKRAFAETGCLEAACGYYAALNPLSLPSSHRLDIRVPTVSFAGLDDMIAPRAYQKARRCFSGPYEVVTMPGGHFMHREHPDAFIAALLKAVTPARDRRP